MRKFVHIIYYQRANKSTHVRIDKLAVYENRIRIEMCTDCLARFSSFFYTILLMLMLISRIT